MPNHITQLLKNLPSSPGCYLFKNTKGKIIYIGKAKNLKNRVRSYFAKNNDLTPAKQDMVAQITDLDYITVRTETEALLLESNLIKEHQPAYNVVLKDDKFFTYIEITNEAYPKVLLTRRVTKATQSTYYGPYSSSLAAKNMLKFLKKIAPFRTSNTNDFYFDVLNRNQKIPKDEYLQNIQTVRNVLEGKTETVRTYLEKRMHQASTEKSYEQAALFRDRLRDLKKLTARQQAILIKKINADIVGFAHFQKKVYLTILKMREGKIIDTLTAKLSDPLADTPATVRLFLVDLYTDITNYPDMVLLPGDIELDETALTNIIGKKIKLAFPKQGKFKKLLELAQLNADEYARKNQPAFAAAQDIQGGLEQLAKALNLKKVPNRIECYDISNVQGRHAVGSMVVFDRGESHKSQYRKFAIKYIPTDKPNDFAMMSEVVARRLRHTEWPTADLIIIDGGKGQLSAAIKSLNNANIAIPIVGLAKKKEELFVPDAKKSVQLPKNSAGYFLLQRIRDEAHRFAISYYRKKHGKSYVK